MSLTYNHDVDRDYTKMYTNFVVLKSFTRRIAS